MTVRFIHGDCRTVLPTLDAGSVQCIVTSPPYFGLRDYGSEAEIGKEASPAAYVAELVAVFREVRRVLRDDGTCWLNLGDSYSLKHFGRRDHGGAHPTSQLGPNKDGIPGGTKIPSGANWLVPGAKPKDLLMMPARVAIALCDDGWFLRSDIIWAKPNPMPESVTDRPTSSHEHVFLLTKQARYYYDADAVREEAINEGRIVRYDGTQKNTGHENRTYPGAKPRDILVSGRNLRNVWTIATAPYAEAHFATFPPELAERCIRAGSKPDDTILDPFSGAGTTALVADRLGRHAIGIDLNPQYGGMARERVAKDAGLFAVFA
jgi:DNA modification methylase